MKLSLLSILIGVGLSLPQIYGLVQPKGFAVAARKFPRNFPIGVGLMLLATAWFVYNVNGEPIADFSAFKPYMLVVFAAVGVLSCIFVRDFLAARALAVIFMLLGKLMVDTGRPHLGESSFVLVNQVLAYAFVVGGIWFTIAPWRLRDWLEKFTANDTIVRLGCAARLTFDIFLIVLGLTAFKGM
jgi:predicted DNA-binding transcriptional regulator AlpA